MLSISMIADKIYDIPKARILMKNTDGLEVYHLRTDKDLVEKILNEISELINIPIEIGYYSKMIILNVNNYIAVDVNKKVKTKGLFEDYNDIIIAGMYHKDTSAMIIPKALKAFFVNDIPVEQTINEENSIYEFCYGNKGSSSYKWMLTEYDPELKVATSELFDSRFIRYYAGGYQTISQLWTNGKKAGQIQAVQAKTPVTLAMNIPKEDIFDYKKGERIYKEKERYPNLNREWYISECYKIINQILNNEKV